MRSSEHRQHSHASHHRRKRLKRWQKNLIHGFLLAALAIAIWHDGLRVTDSLTFMFSLVTEVS